MRTPCTLPLDPPLDMAKDRLKKFKNDPEIKQPYAKSIEDDNEKS